MFSMHQIHDGVPVVATVATAAAAVAVTAAAAAATARAAAASVGPLAASASWPTKRCQRRTTWNHQWALHKAAASCAAAQPGSLARCRYLTHAHRHVVQGRRGRGGADLCNLPAVKKWRSALQKRGCAGTKYCEAMWPRRMRNRIEPTRLTSR